MLGTLSALGMLGLASCPLGISTGAKDISPRIVFMVFRHGRFWGDWYPDHIQLRQVEKGVFSGSLKDSEMGAYFGPEFKALTPELTMVQGLDCPYLFHHSFASALAASYRKDLGDEFSSQSPNSIDTLLARSGIFGCEPTVLRVAPGGGDFETHSFVDGICQTGISNSKDLLQYVSGRLRTGESANSFSESYLALGKATQAIYKELAPQDRRVMDNYLSVLKENELIQSPKCISPLDGVDNFEKQENLLTADEDGLFADLVCLDLLRGRRKIVVWRIQEEQHNWAHGADDWNQKYYQNFMRAKITGRFADLTRRMAKIEMSDGSSLLSNSLVFLLSDMGNSSVPLEKGGNHHLGLDMPVLIAGGSNLGLKKGVLIKYQSSETPIIELPGYIGRPGRLYNDLFLTVANRLAAQTGAPQHLAQFGELGCRLQEEGRKSPCAKEGHPANKLYNHYELVKNDSHPATLPYLFGS